MAWVLVPAMRRPEYRGVSASLLRWTGIRFRGLGWASLGLLVVTGVFNLSYRGISVRELWGGLRGEGPFGRVLAAKLSLVALLFLLSAAHDFWVGPRATRQLERSPAAPRARRLSRQARWIGRINLFMGLAAVLLGVIIARG